MSQRIGIKIVLLCVASILNSRKNTSITQTQPISWGQIPRKLLAKMLYFTEISPMIIHIFGHPYLGHQHHPR